MNLLLLKLAAAGCLFAAVGCSAAALMRQPESGLGRRALRYTRELDRRARRVFAPTSGRAIALAQCAASLACLLAMLGLRALGALLLLAPIWAGPLLVLHLLRLRHVRRIEARLDGFLLSLANALRTNPALGSALASVLPNAPSPLDRELASALREVRLGSTVEQALQALSARVGSLPLEAAIMGMLIGRRVGGAVPEILETTASTLREMARLSAVLRAKTADGRVQAIALGVAPVLLVLTFECVRPGYFRPLTESGMGAVVCMAAGACWICSVLLSRKILAVKA